MYERNPSQSRDGTGFRNRVAHWEGGAGARDFGLRYSAGRECSSQAESAGAPRAVDSRRWPSRDTTSHRSAPRADENGPAAQSRRPDRRARRSRLRSRYALSQLERPRRGWPRRANRRRRSSLAFRAAVGARLAFGPASALHLHGLRNGVVPTRKHDPNRDQRASAQGGAPAHGRSRAARRLRSLQLAAGAVLPARAHFRDRAPAAPRRALRRAHRTRARTRWVRCAPTPIGRFEPSGGRARPATSQ